MTALLELHGLRAGYAQVEVLRQIDLTVHEGQIAVLLGANGAGKTTTLRAVSQIGGISATGSIRFAGTDLVGVSPEHRARLGIAHVPEGRGTFAELSVLENLRIGGFTRREADVERDLAIWLDVFDRLKQRQHQPAGSLSGGEQQMLAVARALMSRPKILLLDEPSLGLAPNTVADLFAELARLNREFAMTMLIVEQNARLALSIAHNGFVLEGGRIVLRGAAQDLINDDGVRRAYLGV